MNTSASRFLALLVPDAPIEGPGVTIVPLLRTGDPKLAYVSMRRAFEAGVLTVTEVTQGGSVPDLAVVNDGDSAVLLLDGEEVAGAKQNRMLNSSILIDARGKLVVPVSCTESGRWSYNDPKFTDSGFVAPRSVRVPKSASVHESLRMDRRHVSDQGEVWSRVEDVHFSLGTMSDTRALRDAMMQSKEELDAMIAAFRPLPNQVGLVAVCADGFVGMDAVSRPDVYADLHEKLVRSYVVDLIGRGATGNVALDGRLDAFLASVIAAAAEPYPSPGLGTDERLVSDRVGGAALVVGEETIHLGAFTRPTGADPARPVASDRIGRRHWRY